MSLATKSEAVAAFIARAAGAKNATVTILSRLGGGAIQENWAIDVEIADGPQAGRYEAVLRGDAVSGIAESWPRAKEYALIAAAHAAGVTVPEPLWLEPSGEVTGRPFYVMRRVKGIAQGRRLLRSLEGEAGEALAKRLGTELAKLHRITPATAPQTLAFLPKASVSGAVAGVILCSLASSAPSRLASASPASPSRLRSRRRPWAMPFTRRMT